MVSSLDGALLQGELVVDVQGMMIGNGWFDPVSQVCGCTGGAQQPYRFRIDSPPQEPR